METTVTFICQNLVITLGKEGAIDLYFNVSIGET